LHLIMISIEEAKKIIEKNMPHRQVEEVALTAAMGRVLAEDIVAPEPSPRFTNSAMDGFAARWEDIQNANEANPINLPIVGESSAGGPYIKSLQKGEAVRISTGGVVPEGADAVVPQEDTQFGKETVTILKVSKKNQNMRFTGEEFARGNIILHRGTEINSAKIGLLASSGIQSVSVFRRPLVSVIVTGSEIQPFDAPVKPWQIRDSNSIMLQSAIQEAGGEVTLKKIVRDNLKDTQTALKESLRKSDIIIFSGGVSVGPHDLVKDAAQKGGFKTLFWKVNQKPGQPLFAARKENTLLFGLPGNPVSACMCYILYIQPVIKYFQGKMEDRKLIKGKLKERVENRFSRDHLMRIKVEKQAGDITLITPLKKQGSHMLTTLTEADGFILVKALKTLPAESVVAINLF